MKIAELKARGEKIADRKGAIFLLAEFISYPSALQNRESHFSFEDKKFRKFLGAAKTFANTWGIEFNLSLYVASMINQEGVEPIWNSSTGSCGWVNPGEVGEE